LPKSKGSSGVVLLQRVDNEKILQARDLRKSMTHAESILWEELRNKRMSEFKFRRQQIIEGFIVDFFCNAAKLVVEIDGSVHDVPEQKQLDEHREHVFQARGLTVIRFKNEEIEFDIDSVLEEIQTTLLGRASPSPFSDRRGDKGVRS
jgi:very-short-patch-repair endonuclease